MEPSKPEVQVPFSDSLLLSVSVAGFCVLAVTVYKILLAKAGAAKGDENDDADDADLSPEEWLVRRANVATLNRGQRRLRARAIMREQRRAAVPQPHHPAAAQDGDPNDDDEAEQQEEPAPQAAAAAAAEAEENHQQQQQQQQQLSRKERQAAAKAREREERLRYRAERQRQQEEALRAAQRQKRERRAAAEAARREAARAEQEQREGERAARETFLRTDAKTQSVQEFAAGATAADRAVRLERVASDFGVTVRAVEERLRQLVREGRLAGFFDTGADDDDGGGDGRAPPTLFVAVSPEELEQMAASILEKGTVTLSEIATLCEEVMQNSDRQKSQEQH